jgi:hypothetical protein
MTMRDLTEKEYDELDELLTQTTPKVKANGTGFISRRQIIDDLVREKIAASA